jgi:hypothetical protein
MCLGPLIAGLALSLIGVFDLLVRQCRSKSVGGVSSWLIPVAWSAGAIVVMIGPLALLFALTQGWSVGDTIPVFGCFSIFFFIVAALALFIAVKRWRKAVEAYYRFE